MASLIVFCGSIGLILYVLAFYPIILGLIAKWRGRPVRRDDVLRSVSVVIAVRNGERFLADKLDSILALNYPKELIEILVVSDGSDDGTDEIARAYHDRGVTLWRIPRSGKAAAVNLGVSKARNEILVMTDVRQRLDVDSVRRVVECFGDPEVGAVSGELSILSGETNEEADTQLYWRYEVWIRKQMSAIDSTFGTNGPFYAMRRSLAVPIPQSTLLDDVYLPLAAFFKGYRLVLDASAKAYDYPTNLSSEFKRKVRTQAGLYQILTQYPHLLGRSNRMRMHFLSAKFGRLIIPYMLVLIFVSSLFLPHPLGEIALILQSLVYGFAVLDPYLPTAFPLRRLTGIARTFVVLVAASAMGLKVFFVPARELWKETKVRKVSG